MITHGSRWLLGPGGRGMAWVVLVLAIGAASAASRLTIDNRIERWLDPDGDSAQAYAQFQESFGTDSFVLVAIGGGDPLSEEALEIQAGVVESLERTPHVTSVLGPSTLHRDLFDEPDPGALRRELLASPFYRRFVVSDAGDFVGVWLVPSDSDDPAAARDLIAAVRVAARPLEAAGFEVHVVGPPVLNAALDGASRREAQRSFPVALTLSVVLLLGLFGCWRVTLVALACAGLTLLFSFGAMGLSGRPLNMVTSVLPSLLWVLSLAGAIHVLRRYQAHRLAGADLEAALSGALGESVRPCVLAAVTTALGFGSLLTASMLPVRELGVFAAVGMLASLLSNLVVGPQLVRWLRVPAPRRHGAPAGPALWLELPSRYPGAILLGAGVIVVGAVLGIRRIEIESDPLAFLPPDDRVVQDYDAVAAALTGYYALEVVVDVPSGSPGWEDPSVWEPLEALEESLVSQPGVVRVLSPLDLLRQLNRWAVGDPAGYRLPPDAVSARAMLDESGGLVRAPGFPLVADDGRRLRLAALVNVMPSSELAAIEQSAREAVAKLPAPLTGSVTGIVPRLVEAQLDLVDTQVRSFGVAFLTIFGCLWVGLRSIRMVAVSVLPNTLPIVVALGAMGWLGIALDAATVMMASVALGIAVDDTVHVLATYEQERASSPRGAARRAIAHVGPAMMITTATACIGFLALRLSDFLPIRWFGLLSALAMVVALVADLWLVPVLLSRSERGDPHE